MMERRCSWKPAAAHPASAAAVPWPGSRPRGWHWPCCRLWGPPPGAGQAATGQASTGQASTGPGRAPLAGKIIGIDPGHNGLNYTSPAFLNRKIWNGREWEGCDTTGTRTAGGYTEARFTWNVATYLRATWSRWGRGW